MILEGRPRVENKKGKGHKERGRKSLSWVKGKTLTKRRWRVRYKVQPLTWNWGSRFPPGTGTRPVPWCLDSVTEVPPRDRVRTGYSCRRSWSRSRGPGSERGREIHALMILFTDLDETGNNGADPPIKGLLFRFVSFRLEYTTLCLRTPVSRGPRSVRLGKN